MYQEDSLTEKLAYHTSNIKLHPKDSNGYYMLAQTLEELGTLNINDNANNYFQQALENYNKAISLYNDPIYMAKLSKLYVKLGEHDLEITSIKEMQKYKTSDVLTKEYVDTVVHDVMGMNEVRDTVKNLQSAGKITNEFAIKLQEHINITAELVAAVDAHSRALDEHEKRINEFQIINEKFINGIQVEAEEIDKVKNWATELKRELLKREKEIEKEFNEYEDKNKEIERIESEKAQKEIKKLKKELEKKNKKLKEEKNKNKTKTKEFENRLKELENKFEKKEIEDAKKDEIIRFSGIEEKAKINKEIQELKQNNIRLYDYCNTFYCNIKNISEAFRIAQTNILNINTQNEETKVEKAVSGGTKIGLAFLNAALQSLPFFGGAADLITDFLQIAVDDILEERQKIKFENKVTSINDIINNKVGTGDIDDYLRKIAISMTISREEEIKKPKVLLLLQSNSELKTLQKNIKEIGNIIHDNTRGKLLPEALERYDNSLLHS